VSATADRLKQAEQDLENANRELSSIQANEAIVSGNSAKYAAWRQERDRAAAELVRLEKLIGLLRDETMREDREELAELVAHRNRANAILADRIRTEGTAAVELLIGLVRDLAESALEDAKLNRRLPDDMTGVGGADALARSIPMRPHEIIAEEIVEQWVFSETGVQVGDQTAVTRISTTAGTIGPSSARCARRKFRVVDYHDAVPMQRLTSPFLSSLRLPNCDRPGLAYDGDIISHYTDGSD
jgi:hypothetical protein